jgi:hypothetical protein
MILPNPHSLKIIRKDARCFHIIAVFYPLKEWHTSFGTYISSKVTSITWRFYTLIVLPERPALFRVLGRL